MPYPQHQLIGVRGIFDIQFRVNLRSRVCSMFLLTKCEYMFVASLLVIIFVAATLVSAVIKNNSATVYIYYSTFQLNFHLVLCVELIPGALLLGSALAP